MSENPFKTPSDDRPIGQGGRLTRVWRRFLANIETLSKRQADFTAMTSVDGEVEGISISNPPTQGEVEDLRDKVEKIGDDVRAIQAALIAKGLMRSS